MSRERWRAVEAVLHDALEAEPSDRNAVIARACGSDDALRMEVASLLAAHVGDADSFLERPSAHSLMAAFDAQVVSQPDAMRGVDTARRDASRPPSPRGRTIPARLALYAAGVMLLVGLAAGVVVDRAYLLGNGTGASRLAAVSGTGAPPAAASAPLMVVDRTGQLVRSIPAERPWTPRFSPDGKRIAYGAFGAGRETNDLWVTDLDAGTTRRITDDDADANDPQWSADGARLAYSAGSGGNKDVMTRSLAMGDARVIAVRGGSQFPSDWSHDGRSLLVTDEVSNGHDVLVQPADGSAARPYVATGADETAARFSPDGRWVAYTSDVSGRAEVYVDAWPASGQRVMLSAGGGVHPVWRADGRELFYWRDGALVALRLGVAAEGKPPAREGETVLFQAPYQMGINTMYDVSPDGQRFVIVTRR